MSFDRSKFRATKVQVSVEKDKELSKALGKEKKFTQYLKIDEGVNLFRIYPPHPVDMGGGDVFAEPKVVVFLPMLLEEKDDKGNVVMERGKAKLIERNKSVFNARIHGGLEKDLVEEYIKYALSQLESQLETCQDTEEQLEITSKIESIKGSFQKKIQGLRYNQSWVMYVDKINHEHSEAKEFGMLEIKPAIKNRLNQLAVQTDISGNPISTDPFTDLDEGRAIIIEYDPKSPTIQGYYKTEIDHVSVPQEIAGKRYNLQRLFPITDEQLEKFCQETPLAKKFKNVFSQRDFQLQMDGLEYFDKKNKLGFFHDAEFVEIIEEIAVTVPEDQEEEEQEGSEEVQEVRKAPTRSVATPIRAIEEEEEFPQEEEEEVEKDEFDLMTRKELHQWHRDNETGIQIIPSMTDDQIREYARNFVADSEFDQEEVEAPQEEEKEEVVPQEEEVQETVQKKSVKSVSSVEEKQDEAPQDRLKALRSKISKK